MSRPNNNNAGEPFPPLSIHTISYRAPISIYECTDHAPRVAPVTARSDDAVLKLFNDKELSANVVKLKSTTSSGVARKGATNKKSANWKDSRQSDNQRSPCAPPSLVPDH